MKRDSFLLFVASWTLGCGGGSDTVELDVSFVVDGDALTIAWNPNHAVHEVSILSGATQNVVWELGTFEDEEFPNTAPTILPPLEYGQEVDNAFTHFGPEPLEKGSTYVVSINEFAWGETCKEYGIPVETPEERCFIADAFVTFTFE